MYTIGIRKIFFVNHLGLTFDNVVCLASFSGFSALSFNGDIFIETENKWVKTTFTIDDFKE